MKMKFSITSNTVKQQAHLLLLKQVRNSFLCIKKGGGRDRTSISYRCRSVRGNVNKNEVERESERDIELKLYLPGRPG